MIERIRAKSRPWLEIGSIWEWSNNTYILEKRERDNMSQAEYDIWAIISPEASLKLASPSGLKVVLRKNYHNEVFKEG